jgi:uncharacterized membrane protein
MKNSRVTLCILSLVLVFAIATSAADTPALKFRFTKANVPGAQQTEPFGINNAGVMVGEYVDSSGVQHAYILNGKKLTKLDHPNAETGSTWASNLNPDGPVSVVGYYVSSRTGQVLGFLYKNGKYTDIPGPSGAVYALGFGINDNGAIVGAYVDSAGSAHGFLLAGKKYTTLNVPGASGTAAHGINKSGKIVVTWEDSNSNVESALYDGKTYKTIDVPLAVDSYPGGINAAGDVCYGWTDAIGVQHGALRHNGKYYKFDYPNSTATYGYGINDKGNTVGYYSTLRTGITPFGYEATYK